MVETVAELFDASGPVTAVVQNAAVVVVVVALYQAFEALELKKPGVVAEEYTLEVEAKALVKGNSSTEAASQEQAGSNQADSVAYRAMRLVKVVGVTAVEQEPHGRSDRKMTAESGLA